VSSGSRPSRRPARGSEDLRGRLRRKHVDPAGSGRRWNRSAYLHTTLEQVRNERLTPAQVLAEVLRPHHHLLVNIVAKSRNFLVNTIKLKLLGIARCTMALDRLIETRNIA
jgi:hypothetical protein